MLMVCRVMLRKEIEAVLDTLAGQNNMAFAMKPKLSANGGSVSTFPASNCWDSRLEIQDHKD